MKFASWLSSFARLSQVASNRSRRRYATLAVVAEVLEDRSLLAAPTFSPASYTFGPFSENTTTPFSISNVTATDPDGGSISYAMVTGGPLFSVDPTGSILLNGPFTQASYSLMISATDNQNETTVMPAMVTVSVNDDNGDGVIGAGGGGGGGGGMPMNDPPDAVDDSGTGFTTDEDTLLTTPNLLSNDSDPNGDTLSIASVMSGSYGFASANTDGTIDFTPSMVDDLDDGDTRTATISYTISDGNGGQDMAQVTITITGVNDAPDVQNDSVSLQREMGLSILVSSLVVNDSDPDDPIAPSSITVTAGTNGSPSIVVNDNGTPSDPTDDIYSVLFTPDPGVGVATFTYNLTDDNGASDSVAATVTITITNSPPVAVNNPDNDASTLEFAGFTTDEDTALTLTQADLVNLLDNDSDLDGDTLSVVNVTGGSSGSVTRNDNGTPADQTDDSFTYEPNYEMLNYLAVGATQIDTISYTIDDGNGGQATADFEMTITGVNDAPVAVDNTTDGSTADGNMIDDDNGDGVDSDAEGDSLDVIDVDGVNDAAVDVVGTYGALDWDTDGMYSYILDMTNVSVINMAEGDTLDDAFVYTISDGNGGADTATLTITITVTFEEPLPLTPVVIVTGNGSVTGTIISGPNTRIDLPANALVISSNQTTPGDGEAIDFFESDPIDIREDISGWDAVKTILYSRADGSVPMLVLAGHGGNGGVASLGGGIDYSSLMSRDDREEILNLIGAKLTSGALILILGCCQARSDFAWNVQLLANETSHSVIANASSIELGAGRKTHFLGRFQGPLHFYNGVGDWIQFDP